MPPSSLLIANARRHSIAAADQPAYHDAGGRFVKMAVLPARNRHAFGEEALRSFFASGAFAFAAGFPGAHRLPRRHKLMLAGTDEIGTAHALERFAQYRPVLRI